MASGEMNFHGGNYSATVVIDANDALLKAQQLDSQIEKILKVLSTVARGKDVTPYWNKDRITKERILQAANVFRESETVEAAFELTKLANAYSAHHGLKSAAEEFLHFGLAKNIAMELGYYKTVIWIEENRSAYCRFIMTGEEPADKLDEKEDTP